MNHMVFYIKENKKKSISIFIFLIFCVVIANIRMRFNSIQRVQLKRGDLSTSIYGSGQLKTNRSFDLKLGTSAKIIEIKKSLGNKVKKGEIVVIFDNLPIFKAPIDGVLTAINFKSGETAFAQTLLLSIVEPKDFYLEMSLDQKSIRLVKEGQQARISFDGYRDLKINGSVTSTFSNNGLFYAIIEIKNPDPSFLPGMSADIAIVTETKQDVLIGPLGAIKNGKILMEINNQPIEVSVATGVDDGKFIEIQGENLQAGMTSVIRSSLPEATKFSGK